MKRRDFGILIPGSAMAMAAGCVGAEESSRAIVGATTFEKFKDVMWDHVIFAAEQEAELMERTSTWDTEASCKAQYMSMTNVNGDKWVTILKGNFDREMGNGKDPGDLNDNAHYSYFYYQCAQLAGKYAVITGDTSIAGRVIINPIAFEKALRYVQRVMKRVSRKQGSTLTYHACS